MIVDPEDLERGQIDERMQSLDRMRIVVVEWKHPHPKKAGQHPPVFLDLVTEITNGPRVDADELKLIQQPPAPERFLNAGILFYDLLDQEDLLHSQHWACVWFEFFRNDFAVPEMDAALPYAHDVALIDIEACDPLDRITRGE